MNNSQEINEGLEEYEEEKKEEQEKKNKKKDNINSMTLSGQKSFVQYKLSEDIDFFNDKNLEVENIYQNFLEYLKDNDEYSDFAIDVANFSDAEKKVLQEQIKKESINQRIGINKNIASVKKIIDKEFKITNKKLLDQKLKELYKEKNGKEKIKQLLKRYNSRLAFLKKNLNGQYKSLDQKSKDNNKDVNEVVENIKGLEPDKLTQKQLETIKKIYFKTQSLDSSDIISFLGLLDIKNAKAILEHFNPSISVKTLRDNHIITEKDLIKILKKDTGFNEKDIKNALKNNSLNLSNIFLTIDDLNKNNIIKLLENKEAVQPIVDELNETRREIEKNSTQKFHDLIDLNEENDYKIHKQFIDFIKEENLGEVPESVINSIDNFKAEQFLKVKSPTQESYYQITDIDLGGTKSGKHIKIKNLSHRHGGIKEPEEAEEEIMTYEDLYKLFKSANKQDNTEVEFINDKNFKSIKEKLGTSLKTDKELKDLLIKNKFLDESLRDADLRDLKFKDKEKGEEFLRTFFNVNNNKGELTFAHSNQVMKYSDFFDEFKRNGKYELEEKFPNTKELLKNSKFFKDNEIVLHKSGKKLVFKDDEDKDKVEGIKYLFSEDNKAIHIKKVDENNIEFTTGTVTANTEEKDGKKITKYNIKEKLIYQDQDALDYLDLNVNNENKVYKAQSYEVEAEVDNDNSKPFKEKGSFFRKIMSMSSIAEIIQGGEMTINAMKEYLERGNDLRAAKWAQTFGGILPNTVQAKLQFNTTEKRKEVVEKVFKQLTEMNSDDAIKYIRKDILENKHASKEEVFAAIRFMAEKRGNLYGKGFTGLEGTYMWVKKLGFKTNSSEFREREKKKKGEVKNNVVGKKDPSNIIEEDLLENVVLKDLGKGGDFLYPRVEKDFNKYINAGQANRYKKGEDETTAMHTISEKTDNFVGQLKGGEKARAMAAMKKILDKNSTIESIHFPGFLLSMSGYPKYFFPTEINHVLAAATTSPSSSLLFSLSHDGIDTYQKAIIQFYKDKGDLKKAQKLEKIINSIDRSEIPKNDKEFEEQVKKHKKVLEDLSAFWSENDQEIMDFATLKDGHILLNKDKNPIYQNFYNTINDYYNAGSEFNVENGDFLSTKKYRDSPLADVTAKIDKITVYQNGALNGDTAKKLFDVYIHRLQEIKNLEGITEEQRKKLWLRVFNPFIEQIWEQIVALVGRAKDNMNLFDDLEVVKRLKDINIELPIKYNLNISQDEYKEKVYRTFMKNSIKNEEGSSVESVTNEIPNAAKDILEGNVEPKNTQKTVYEDPDGDFENKFEQLKET